MQTILKRLFKLTSPKQHNRNLQERSETCALVPFLQLMMMTNFTRRIR